MRVHHIESRPHVQGCCASLRLRHSSGDLTDGGGLLLVRRLWDQLDIGRWLNARSNQLGGRFRSPLMIELWIVGAVAYQVLHVIRTTALRGVWRRAQPERLRAWLFRLPGKFTRHARKDYVQLVREEPLRKDLLSALRELSGLSRLPLSALSRASGYLHEPKSPGSAVVKHRQ